MNPQANTQANTNAQQPENEKQSWKDRFVKTGAALKRGMLTILGVAAAPAAAVAAWHTLPAALRGMFEPGTRIFLGGRVLGTVVAGGGGIVLGNAILNARKGPSYGFFSQKIRVDLPEGKVGMKREQHERALQALAHAQATGDFSALEAEFGAFTTRRPTADPAPAPAGAAETS